MATSRLAAPRARIVVGVDGSDSAQAALRWAVGQAKLAGGRGRGAVTSALIGSVSLHCVLHAHCPVLVLREPE
jgi:nucleotide-binding universal stress UspA family protein